MMGVSSYFLRKVPDNRNLQVTDVDETNDMYLHDLYRDTTQAGSHEYDQNTTSLTFISRCQPYIKQLNFHF